MIKKFPLAGAASFVLATLFMVSPSHAQSIIQIAPPSTEQLAAIASAAALKVITTDPNRIPIEQRARDLAVKDGTTLEANLFLNGHVKGNVPLEELDKAMGWSLGTMSQWKAGRWENRAGEDEYSAMWRYGKSHNMTTTQLEDAVGFIPGTLNNWARSNGLMPAQPNNFPTNAPAVNPPTVPTVLPTQATIILIAPPSAEQLAAIERAAILKAAAHQQNPLAAEQERKARRQAALDGMTLEAWMLKFSKNKKGDPIGNAGIDRVFDWAEGTMDRWEQNQSRKASFPKPYSPMEIKTLLPELAERERRGREIALNKGTTLEAELLNTMIKNKMEYSQIDKSMGWPVGTMAQWDRSQTATTNSTTFKSVFPKADEINLRPAVNPPTVQTVLPTQATIIQIVPPSTEQLAALSRAAALKVITTDSNRIPTERRARDIAVRDGTTLEANLFLNGHIKGNVPLAELDKAMGWPAGTMSQWKAGRWEGRAGEDEYSAMVRYGKSHNMTTTQLEKAAGFTPGTLDNWARRNGLMPVPQINPGVLSPRADDTNLRPVSPRADDTNLRPVSPRADDTNLKPVSPRADDTNLRPVSPRADDTNFKPVSPKADDTNFKPVSPKADDTNLRPAETRDRAVIAPKSKPNVCALNPGKFKGCSVF